VDSSQSYPVISLRNNAGRIHYKLVGYHYHPNPPVIPNEKDNRKNKNHPMRNLSPASFKGEFSYVCHIKVTEMLFPESTLKYGGAIWQKSFPCFDSQESLISSSTSFPTAFSIKPRFWIKGVGPHFRE